MLIYNVTIQVENSVAAQWLQWLQQEHIPEVLLTGCFSKYQLVKILNAEETATATYAVQYYAADNTQLDHYLENYAQGLRQKGFDRWGNRFIAFRTIMEVIN
jgi:hypothetical protein